MGSSLIDTIENVEPEPLTRVVSELLVARERLDAKVCEAFTAFVARGEHQVDGAASAAGWLRAHGLGDRDATRLAVRCRRLAAWPTLARLWFDGSLSQGQIDLVVGSIPTALVETWADHDHETSPLLVGLSRRDTRAVLRHWVARAEAIVSGDGPRGVAPESTVWVSRTLGGTAILDGTLDADTAALTDTALRVAARPDRPGVFRCAAERRGEAFGRIMRFFLDHHATPGDRPGRQHPHVAVTIELADLFAAALRGSGIATSADLEALLAAHPVGIIEEALLRDALAHASGEPVTLDGHHLTPTSLSRLFTHGTLVHHLLTAGGVVLDRGRTRRLATPTLRDAVLARDRNCRYPHCDAPAAWVDIHHLRPWEDGGPTDLVNLVGLCATHHGLVHRTGWSLTADLDGTLSFTRPDGVTVVSPPPRRHRPPPLPLRHPQTDGLLGLSTRHGAVADPSHSPSREAMDGGGPLRLEELDEHRTCGLVRARVVDLVRRHRRCDHPAPPPPSRAGTG